MVNSIIKGFGKDTMDIFFVVDLITITHVYTLFGMKYTESYSIYVGEESIIL